MQNKEALGLMQNYLISNKEEDEWFNISKNKQEVIKAAINELNEDKGIPHQELMTKLKNKFSTLSHA